MNSKVPFRVQKKVASESNVVAMATFWQPPRCTKSPHNEEHWLFPTSRMHRRVELLKNNKRSLLHQTTSEGWRKSKESALQHKGALPA
ncbi:uncharacterized [Tachysurus ichikawai]